MGVTKCWVTKHSPAQLSSYPLCVYICVQGVGGVYVYHICFIHSSTDGYLGCSHIVATVSDATVNIVHLYIF